MRSRVCEGEDGLCVRASVSITCILFFCFQKLTPLLGSAFLEERRQRLDAQTPAGGAWSRVRDGTCQEEVGHERRDNKTESGRGGGRKGAIQRLEIQQAQSRVAKGEASGDGRVDVSGERRGGR